MIERDHGVFALQDATSIGEEQKPQHVYTVRFDARELWGPTASTIDRIYVDLWDEHLDPA